MKSFFRRDWIPVALEARDQYVVLRLYMVGLAALTPPAVVIALLGGAGWAIYSALPLRSEERRVGKECRL